MCCTSLDMTIWCLKNQSKAYLMWGAFIQNHLSDSKTAAFSFSYSQTAFFFAFYLFFPSGVLSHELLLSLCFSERQVFLATWKDIPNDNEAQFQIKDIHLNSGNRNKYVRCMSELGKVRGGRWEQIK